MSKSVGFPLWMAFSIAIHVGVVNARLAAENDRLPQVTHPMTFELLYEPRAEIPVSIAATSHLGLLNDRVHSIRIANEVRHRPRPTVDAKPAPATHNHEDLVASLAEAPAAAQSDQPAGQAKEASSPLDEAKLGRPPEHPGTPSDSQISGTGKSHARDDYYSSLRAAVERHREYPRAARRARLQGMVVLRLSVSREGHLLSVRVSQSSGEEILDSAALSAVRMAGTLPAAPVEIVGDQVTVELPFVFRLK